MKNRRLCQREVEGQGTELRIGQEMVSEKDDSQGSIWGLSKSGAGGWLGRLSKKCECCAAFYWGREGDSSVESRMLARFPVLSIPVGRRPTIGFGHSEQPKMLIRS